MKLNLGCGWTRREGFLGADIRQYDGDTVDVLMDIRQGWPWRAESVDEVFSSHLLEHLYPSERIHFFNELGRILRPGAKAMIVTPHWSSCRAYGDPTHQWPPVSEYTYMYLDKRLRESRWKHLTGFDCDFSTEFGYYLREDLTGQPEEELVFASRNYRDTIQDLIATLTKREN